MIRLTRFCTQLILLFNFISPCVNANKESLPLEDLQRFTAVLEQIRRYYVKSVEDKDLFEDAIRGMLNGLDPHSSFLDPSEFSDLRANTSGKFGGLGIEVTMDENENFIRVISPIDDTPATKAGIKAGDMIIRLNDVPIKGLTLKKAVEMMRGESGSSILLTILRKGAQAPLKLKVMREVIRVKSVKSKLLDKNYGYVRISQFQMQSPTDLINGIKQLLTQSENNLKGLILDLRNNPGGILESSVKISDAFLDRAKLKHNALIVYTEGRLPGAEIKEMAHDGDILQGAPIVVLVNGGSASAAEIVAGALQDHQRALIVGTPTFGKGSVQTVLPLKDNYGLKLTTALYFTPSGRSIQAKGIVPDIEVPDIKFAEKEDTSSMIMNIRERDLEGHLEGIQQAVTQKSASQASENPLTKELPLRNQDYQLSEALNLLKGLALINHQRALPVINQEVIKKEKMLLEDLHD